MSFYQVSRRKIFCVISEAFPEAEARQHSGHIGKEALPSHLLWMVEIMGSWDTFSVKEAVKAARWIGWIFRAMEELGLHTKEDSRSFSKMDVDKGYHLPH